MNEGEPASYSGNHCYNTNTYLFNSNRSTTSLLGSCRKSDTGNLKSSTGLIGYTFVAHKRTGAGYYINFQSWLPLQLPQLHSSSTYRNHLLIMITNALKLLHSSQYYHPRRTHHFRNVRNLLPHLPCPPKDRTQHASKANLHSQQPLHPLHRLRAIGIPLVAIIRRRTDLPSHRRL